MTCHRCGADIERRLVGGLVIYQHQSKALRRSSDHAAKPAEQASRSGSLPSRVPPTSERDEAQSRTSVLPEPAST